MVEFKRNHRDSPAHGQLMLCLDLNIILSVLEYNYIGVGSSLSFRAEMYNVSIWGEGWGGGATIYNEYHY